MIDAFIILAILVSWSAVFIGRMIAVRVPDEVRDARSWLPWLRDALIIIAFGIAAIGFFPLWPVLSVLALLVLARWQFPTWWSFAAASAFALGAGVLASDAAVAFVIGANLLAGAIEKRVFKVTIAQPVGAILVAILLTI